MIRSGLIGGVALATGLSACSSDRRSTSTSASTTFVPTPGTRALLGSPVWNVRAPMIMSTFTDQVDLAGKTVLPFITYAVSGIGDVEDDHRSTLPDTEVRTDPRCTSG